MLRETDWARAQNDPFAVSGPGISGLDSRTGPGATAGRPAVRARAAQPAVASSAILAVTVPGTALAGLSRLLV
jgi:hypothetical protein